MPSVYISKWKEAPSPLNCDACGEHLEVGDHFISLEDEEFGHITTDICATCICTAAMDYTELDGS